MSKIAEISLEMFGIETNEDNLDTDNIVSKSPTINIRTTKFLNSMKLLKISQKKETVSISKLTPTLGQLLAKRS